MSKHSIRTIDQVIERASHYMNEEHVAFLQRAYEYAAKAHEGQIRKSGQEYILHPIQVADILIDLKMDPATIAGGFSS